MADVMTVSNLVNRSIAILGMGATGLSVARYLSVIGAPFSFFDSRTEPPALAEVQDSYPNTKIVTEPFRDEILVGIDLIVVSPGISQREPLLVTARKNGIEIIGDLELFLTAAEAPVVAITGSNGKSTVTTLVGEMAKANGLDAGVGGNLGVPMLDLLAPGRELYVVELSSFQLELISDLKGATACLLNISPDHMDRYNDLEDYIAAKQRIFRGAASIVSNREDRLITAPSDGQSGVITFGLDTPAQGHYGITVDKEGDYLCRGDERLISVDSIAIKGRHNLANALAALALGSEIGLDLNHLLTTLQHFKGLPHRCQVVATIDEVLFIDDSKGTNVGATVAAIEGFGSKSSANLILIAGGQGKGQNFNDLRSAASRFVKYGIFYGQDAEKIEDALQSTINIRRVESVESAVDQAKQSAVAGDIVLFSPACASFDLFTGFEERGRHFQHAVLSSETAAFNSPDQGALC
jgi:UDP-N-acetylmuramoylalanine--D-glutamate ligase